MQKLKVASNEAGQRLDKLLSKYLSQAGKGFLYKMMRKKNITLNGKKCDGSERVEEGDEISLFLADETIEKFSAPLPELAALGKEKDRNSGKAGKNGENGNIFICGFASTGDCRCWSSMDFCWIRHPSLWEWAESIRLRF